MSNFVPKKADELVQLQLDEADVPQRPNAANELVQLDDKIVKEAQRWLRETKDLGVSSFGYCSPRISSEIPDCSMPMTFDHYNYCSLGCLYCFAYNFKSNNPVYKNKQIPLKAVNVDDMIAAMRGEKCSARGKRMHHHFYQRKFVLHWGGLADPFCSFERHNNVGLKLIKALGEMDYPTLFSFKGATIFRKTYREVFEQYADQSNFAFQVSIVTNSDDMSRQVEIGCPITSRRIEAIKMLSDMGYYTILRLRPFIMGITDVGLEELLGRSLEAGIKGVSVEWFALDSRCNAGMKQRFAWLAKLTGVRNLQKYYSELSPHERGGYMRLNRRVKEPYMKMIYKFCIENKLTCGVSDPDFKELNTSGSCCGMPDDYPKNRGLENWTRNQLTYHLKMARQKFHQTGEKALLYFRGVYDEESYFEDIMLTHDHVSEVTLPIATRYVRTYRLILQKHWNNLNSPANPRNYFHGKVMPVGTDPDGNLIYQYNPLEYEERWKSEGIDMTR